jgi:hypothetical protein
MEALLYCASCPVRIPCLRESFVTWKVAVRNEIPNKIESGGTWGGSTERERDAVRHLPVEERIKLLEDGFPERLAERIDAFEERHPSEPHRGCSGKTTRNGERRCARARKLLDRLRGTAMNTGEDSEADYAENVG